MLNWGKYHIIIFLNKIKSCSNIIIKSQVGVQLFLAFVSFDSIYLISKDDGPKFGSMICSFY